MPTTEVRVFCEANRDVPLQVWLDDLERSEPKAHEKCLARITELADSGHQMRRPHADMLRDGIYELRATVRHVHYRIFYFFMGRHEAMLSHGNTKEGKVDDDDIDLAIERKRLVKAHPSRHTADFEL